jgi:capsid protein
VSFAKRITDSIAHRFGYHAIAARGKRTESTATFKSEDDILTVSNRRKLLATANDANRNFVLAAWLIRKHLSYVTEFHFQAKTGDKTLDNEVEAAFGEWAEACDVTGRHSLADMIYMWEGRNVVDGDCGLLKTTSGLLQAIEGDRIAKKDGAPETVNDYGLVLDPVGRALAYSVCRRDGNMLYFDRMVNADSMIFDGFYQRFDQIRGISPLSTALNQAIDLYENFDYNLIKTKMHAMFGVAIYSDATGGSGFGETNSGSDSAPDYDFDLRPGLKLQLDPGDKLEVIESRNPSNEFREYSLLMIRLIMLALDIPYSFFDSMGASYSAKRGDLQDYTKATAKHKRRIKRALDNIAQWQIGRMNFRLPRGIDGLKFEWRPAGTPWIDPEKEANGSALQVANGFTSPQRVCKSRGEDFFEILDEIELAQNEIKRRGIEVQLGKSGPIIGENDAQNSTI